MIRYDPFPVSCQKDSTWKVATDERTYLLEFHLKFPGMNLLRVLVDTFSTKPKARKSFHQTSHSTVLCHGVDRLFSRRRYYHPWAKTKNRGKKDNWQKPWRHDNNLQNNGHTLGLNQCALDFCFDACEAYLPRLTVIFFLFFQWENVSQIYMILIACASWTQKISGLISPTHFNRRHSNRVVWISHAMSCSSLSQGFFGS